MHTSKPHHTFAYHLVWVTSAVFGSFSRRLWCHRAHRSALPLIDAMETIKFRNCGRSIQQMVSRKRRELRWQTKKWRIIHFLVKCIIMHMSLGRNTVQRGARILMHKGTQAGRILCSMVMNRGGAEERLWCQSADPCPRAMEAVQVARRGQIQSRKTLECWRSWEIELSTYSNSKKEQSLRCAGGHVVRRLFA